MTDRSWNERGRRSPANRYIGLRDTARSSSMRISDRRAAPDRW